MIITCVYVNLKSCVSANVRRFADVAKTIPESNLLFTNIIRVIFSIRDLVQYTEDVIKYSRLISVAGNGFILSSFN